MIERHIVLDPPTSREVIEKVRQAIDDGSRVVTLTLEGDTPLPVACRITQTRYTPMSALYLGSLAENGGTLTIKVMNHPDMSTTPATVTIVRRD